MKPTIRTELLFFFLDAYRLRLDLLKSWLREERGHPHRTAQIEINKAGVRNCLREIHGIFHRLTPSIP